MAVIFYNHERMPGDFIQITSFGESFFRYGVSGTTKTEKHLFFFAQSNVFANQFIKLGKIMHVSAIEAGIEKGKGGKVHVSIGKGRNHAEVF